MSAVQNEQSGGFRSDPGHLAVKVEGLRPDETVFSFERQPERMSKALLGSLAAHGALVGFAVLMTIFGPKAIVQTFAPEPASQMVFLATPGEGGGGGGGGNQMKEPPPKVELPGKEKITVPVTKPPDVKPQVEKPEPPPQEDLTIPAKSLADSDQPLPGVIESVADASISRGTGTGPGAGTGEGAGMGPGRGRGLGEGEVAGMGGGVYKPGSGVETPRPILQVKPQYTADAMRAKVQGVVWVSAVVNPDGTVGNVHVIRSLDQTFGLDQEALKAAKQWRFVPGTRFGKPVPVEVTIELAFSLR